MDGSVSGVQRMEYVCGGTDGGQNTGGKPGARKPQRSGQKAGASDGNFNRKRRAYPDGNRRTRPGARRRNCAGFPDTGRRRSGNWKIHTPSAGVPHAVHSGHQVLYISGEESLRQIKLRAVRIGEFNENLSLLCETNLDIIRAVMEKEKPEIAVIDSIQTMYNEEVSSAPGSVSQVRESTNVLMQIAKGMGISIFIVGHVTKDGNVAGPRVLEHMVDTVLYFEGDRHASYRILRGVKNRFGSTNEIGVFEMQTEGLVEVKNPSEYMLNGRPEGASGSAVACSMEGTRPILIEIQALVCHSNFGIPRRTAAGCDFNRVNLLMAVLEKRARINLSTSDAYVNIAGGIKMNEPAIDLGITLAVVSSYKDQVIDEKTVVFGEVGLSGEVRAVSMAEQRVLEAKKLGFERVILPAVCMKSVEKIGGIALIPVENIQDAILRVGKN